MKKHGITFIGILFLFVVLAIVAVLQVPQTPILTFGAALVAVIIFFISYEKEAKRARDIMPVVVLTAIAVAGRIVLMPLPNFKPVTAIVIIAGMAFGAESAFMTGALTALISNMFFGQGPWTPWQMLGWGLIGFISGLLAKSGYLQKTWSVLLYGLVSSFLFGIFMDSWTILSYVRPLNLSSALTTFSLGTAFNVSHMISTVLFLLPLEKIWLKQLKRVKIKFGLQ